MDFKDILIILLAIIIGIWGLITLNGFVSGNPILQYVGSPVILGLGVIIFGFLIFYVISNNLHLLEG